MSRPDDDISVDIEGPHRLGDDLRQIGACLVRDRSIKFFVEFYRVPNLHYPDEIILMKEQEAGLQEFPCCREEYSSDCPVCAWDRRDAKRYS